MKHLPSASPGALQASDLLAPLVTVVIVNYNYANFVEQCIRSVALQDYQNIRCLVIECGSTDKSTAVIQAALDRQADARFKLSKLGQNRGHLANALTAIDEIDGAFTVFLDADDFLFPEFVSTHVRAHLNDVNSAALSVSDQIQVDSIGQVLAGTCHWHQKWRADEAGSPWADISRARSWLPQSSNVIEPSLRARLSFVPAWWSSWPSDRWIWSTTSAMMFRTSVVKALAPEQADLDAYGPLNVDGYFARFGHSVGGTLVIGEALGAYRRHGMNAWACNPVLGGQTANSARDEPVRTRILQELACKVLTARYHDLIRLFGGELYYSIAWQLMSNEDFFDFARRYLPDRRFWEGTVRSADATLPPDLSQSG